MPRKGHVVKREVDAGSGVRVRLSSTKFVNSLM